jgi:hypothetical protein
MLKQTSDAVKPTDIIDEFSVRDIVDVTWELLRLRRNKAELLTANMHRGLKQILDPLCGYEQAEELSESWAQGDGDTIKQVDGLLADAGLSMNSVRHSLASGHVDRAFGAVSIRQLRGVGRPCRRHPNVVRQPISKPALWSSASCRRCAIA